jgi:hypothetical protein
MVVSTEAQVIVPDEKLLESSSFIDNFEVMGDTIPCRRKIATTIKTKDMDLFLMHQSLPAGCNNAFGA